MKTQTAHDAAHGRLARKLKGRGHSGTRFRVQITFDQYRLSLCLVNEQGEILRDQQALTQCELLLQDFEPHLGDATWPLAQLAGALTHKADDRFQGDQTYLGCDVFNTVNHKRVKL
jgi:hypothetical protein